MFVIWKGRALGGHNDGRNANCEHTGEGRVTWTPIVCKSTWTPAGPRRSIVLRPGPGMRSCCMRDPIVRVWWWDSVVSKLQASKAAVSAADAERVVIELIKRVPLPTDEEEAINALMFEGGSADWIVGRRAERIAEFRRLAIDRLRPGEVEWGDALAAWGRADEAFARDDWAAYTSFEMSGLSLGVKALAKAWRRPEFVHAWADALNHHRCRFLERQARHEEKAARGRTEEERQRHSEDSRSRQTSAGDAHRADQTLIERMARGPLTECAYFLGVTYPCSEDHLKKAYREAARRHHPDRGGDVEKMKAANVAKQRLERSVSWN